MNKLLSANFARLKKNKFFWLCMGTMLVYALFFMFNESRQARSGLFEPSQFTLDESYFNFAPAIGGFAALFTSMFLGTEYSDGAIRNKLTVGHTRAGVYLSSLVTVYAASLLMLAVWLVGGLSGIPAMGLWQNPTRTLVYLLVVVFFLLAFAAVYTAVAMLCSNKAASVVICMVLYLVMMMIAGTLANRLEEPEMMSGVIMTANGIEMTDPHPNPSYVDGFMRKLYSFIADALPTGQGIQMAWLTLVRPVLSIVSSAVIAVVTTLGGLFAFKRKNIK